MRLTNPIFGFSLLVAGCGDASGGNSAPGPGQAGASGSDSSAGAANNSAGGANDPDDGLTAELTPLVSCAQRELIDERQYNHDIGADSTHYYWIGMSEGDMAIYKKPKSGGEVESVTRFPSYTAYFLGSTELEVSGDSELMMGDVLADELDPYLYFSGDTHIWRVKKDGSEDIERVSTERLNEPGPAKCNFARSQLVEDSLFVCRSGQIFRMDRASNSEPEVVYSAPEGSRIEGFAVNATHVYTNGVYDEARYSAPVLQISRGDGEVGEFGQMPQGIVPGEFLLLDDELIFASLSVISGPDLETTSEWASRQGTYRMGLDDQVAVKISETQVQLLPGADVSQGALYTIVGDQIVRRVTPQGVTETIVDCRDDPDDIRFDELLVDQDGVLVRDTHAFYRFSVP